MGLLLQSDLYTGETIAIFISSVKLPDNIDLLNIVDNDLAITSAPSFSSLAEILSCPVDSFVLIVYNSLETSVSVTN